MAPRIVQDDSSVDSALRSKKMKHFGGRNPENTSILKYVDYALRFKTCQPMSEIKRDKG